MIEPWMMLLVLGFIPLLVKSVNYLVIGGYTPLIVFCLFATLVVWGVRRGGKTRARVVRIWAVAIILWALARLAIFALFFFNSMSEAHIQGHLTAGYVVVSLAYLALGIYLLKNKVWTPTSKHSENYLG